MSLVKKFVKDTAIYGIAAILPKIVNVLLVRLHTDILPPKAYSDNTQFYVYAVYFNVLLTFGMETAFFRFFTKNKDHNKVAQTAFTAILISSIAFLIVLLGFAGSIANFLQINILFYKILISILILDALVVIPYAYLRVTNRPVRFASYRLFNILIYAILNLFLLWWLPKLIEQGYFASMANLYNEYPKVIWIFVANLIASGLTFLAFLPVLSKFRLGIDKKLLRQMLTYGLPIMIAGLAFATNENLDKLLIGRMLDKKLMGMYAAVYKIGVFMSLYVTAFKLGAEPFFFSRYKDENAKNEYSKILLWFTIFGAVFLVAIMAFLSILSHILIGQDVYLQALDIVPVILTAYLLFGVYNNLSVWYKLTDRTRYALYLSVMGALITIGFNLLMIPKIGYMASAWATLAAYGTMTLVSYFLGQKYYKVPYEIGKVLFYIASSALTGFMMYRFSNNLIINTGILVLYVCMVWLIEHKQIKEIFKSNSQ